MSFGRESRDCASRQQCFIIGVSMKKHDGGRHMGSLSKQRPESANSGEGAACESPT